MAKKYTVIISPRAQREIRKFTRRNKSLANALAACLDALASDPRPHGVEKITALFARLRHDPLTGVALEQARHVDLWRIRVEADYRLVYAILDDAVLVIVARIGDRKDVYADLGNVEL